MSARNKLLADQLKLLQHSFDNLDGIAVCRLSGLIEAARLPAEVEPDRLAAAAGPLQALTEALCWQRNLGEPLQLVLRLSDRSFVVLLPMGRSATVVLRFRDRPLDEKGDPWFNLACVIRDLERLL